MDLARPDESPQNPPWLFGLLSIPYGLSNAIITILMPFVLRKNGVAVDRIADVVAVAMIPAVWFFLYSPVVDLGLRRRNWILFTALGAGLCAGAATWLVSSSLVVVTTLLFLASAVSGLMSTANGSLLTRLIPSARGRAGGWYNAGNLGGGAVGGGLAIWLASRLSVPMLGLAVIAMMAAPALAALWIVEWTPERRPFGPLFADLFRDLWDVLRSRRTLIGLVFFLSPVGSGGISNLISGLGPEYHASTNEVLWVTGVASGLLSAVGSLVGGFACDRINRMKAYALSGALGAAFALYLGFAPPNAWTYGAGYSGYSIAVGFAYAVFTALVLEVLGPRRHAAGTSYSLLVASGNVPVVYMTWLDGLGFKQAGARGLAGVDALANGAFALLLFLLAIYARRFWNKRSNHRLRYTEIRLFPKLISIGSFYLPTYGVLVALGFLAGLTVTTRLARRNGLDSARVVDLAVYCALAGLLGAKILMILFDWPSYMAGQFKIFSLATLQAAGVFQGGLVLAFITAFLYMRHAKMPWLPTLDAFAPGIAIGHAIGRIGCFAAGCCWGEKCELPWAVTFHNPDAGELTGVPLGVPLQPSQLYEMMTEALLFVFLYWRFGRPHSPGKIMGLYLVISSVARFGIEFTRFHEQGLYFGLSLTQWISIALAGVGAALLFRPMAPAQLKPSVAT